MPEGVPSRQRAPVYTGWRYSVYRQLVWTIRSIMTVPMHKGEFIFLWELNLFWIST
jgi:hypothetical protein